MAERLIVGHSLYSDIRRARDCAVAGQEVIQERTAPDAILLVDALIALKLSAEKAMEIIERNNPKVKPMEDGSDV